jgi:hypothetical protein
MKIAVLNFQQCQIDIIDNIPVTKGIDKQGRDVTEQVEDILTEELGYNLDEISWMEYGPNTKVNDYDYAEMR